MLKFSLIVILGNVFNLKKMFFLNKKKLSVLQNLGNTFKNLKNHF